MPHITLSIPKNVYNEMKKHKEVNWSEIARRAIIKYLLELKENMHSKEILANLSEESKKVLFELERKKAVKIYKKMREKEWKRIKSMIRIS